jgi:hypothetical protein
LTIALGYEIDHRSRDAFARKNATRKALLDRIVETLTKLGQRGCTMREEQPQFTVGIDPDPDSDPDTDGNQEQADRQQLAPTNTGEA